MRSGRWMPLPALLCAGCVSFNWQRDTSFVPPEPTSVTQLAVGQSTLEDCLAHLGSPLLVEEYGTGMVLYWGWGRERSWGLSVSVPVTENSSASASYDDVDLDLEALSISFDPGLRVEYLQYGRLADLLNAAARPRPQLVEDTAAEK